jgi:tetratricopeptide (TPR) repeat protein
MTILLVCFFLAAAALCQCPNAIAHPGAAPQGAPAPPPQSAPLDRAWDLLAQGRRDEAVRLLREMIKANPRYAEARVLLGSVLMEERQGEESLAQLHEAVRLRPDWGQARNALGEALKAFGDPQAARQAFAKAVECDPKLAPAQVNLGLILLESGESSAAAPHVDRALQILGKNAEAAYPLYLRAKIYSEQGQIKKAAADLDEAVSLQPDFAEAWSDLGSVRKNLLDDPGRSRLLRKPSGLPRATRWPRRVSAPNSSRWESRLMPCRISRRPCGWTRRTSPPFTIFSALCGWRGRRKKPRR